MPSPLFWGLSVKTETQQLANKEWHKTEKGQIAKKRCNKRYLRTDKGKIANKKWQQKWRKTEKGKAAKKRCNKRYLQTENGKMAKRKWQEKYKYGLTSEQRQNMYVEQNGCCVICGQPVSYEKIYVDHNHKTGKVRSLLCNRCNIFVGFVEGTPELINPILKYLEIV